MKELAKVEIAFLSDRGFKKIRVNFVKRNKIYGFLKTF